jgi:hypothetical protein
VGSPTCSQRRPPADPALWRRGPLLPRVRTTPAPAARRGDHRRLPDGPGPARPRGLPAAPVISPACASKPPRRKARGWVRSRGSEHGRRSSNADPGRLRRARLRRQLPRQPRQIHQVLPECPRFHDLTPNLKARLSWSTSFGRPASPTSCPARRQRDEPDRHGEQSRPAAADRHELGRHPRVLLRARSAA